MKKVITRIGWVTIYKEPSLHKGTVNRLQLGEQATLISTHNSYWYKVSFEGKVGYITTNSKYTKLITVEPKPVPPKPVPPKPIVPQPSPIEIKREKVVKTALSLIGKVQYVHWRDRQESVVPYSTDCSGYTYLVYRLADIGVQLVNRDDDDQALVGQSIPYGQFEKGDLIFTWNSGSKDSNDVGHVGIYIGDGKMIHNASPSSDVVISNIMTDYYKRRFIVARRVIQ